MLELTLASQVYREYRDKFARRLLRRASVPWMRHRELDTIREVIQSLQPRMCLEWGAGYSTLHFPRLLSPEARWVSVEHDAAWASRVRNMNRDPRVTVFCVPPNQFPRTDADGSEADLSDYLEFPARFAPFDFILIDGRARAAALQRARAMLSENGVVVLHDANRRRYLDATRAYAHQLLLQDYRADEGGLWIGSDGAAIESVLDVARQRRLWAIWTRIGPFLRC
jgi:predicted O-methyltransferase YrrM